jgi:hypothetical protein
VGEICAWLNETEDLNLPALAQIEAKVATKFEAPEFTDLGHKSFLYLATRHPTIVRVLNSLTVDLRQQSGQRQLFGYTQIKHISRDHVFDFIQQCGLGKSSVRPLYFKQFKSDDLSVFRSFCIRPYVIILEL